MNFLKEKVQKYQEKKLIEAKDKLRFHTNLKNQLESELKSIEDIQSNEVKMKIKKQNELIEIWTKNIESVKKQLKKLKS